MKAISPYSNIMLDVPGYLCLRKYHATIPPTIENIIGISHHHNGAFSLMKSRPIHLLWADGGACCLRGCPQLGHVRAADETVFPQTGQETIAGGKLEAGGTFVTWGMLAPQLPQNFAPTGTAAPQLGQVLACACPEFWVIMLLVR